MDPSAHDLLATLRNVNAKAAFNRWIGLEVVSAEPGRAVIEIAWRDDFGQYAGFLHAAMIGGLIDTACGFAAATVAGSGVLASHFAVNCLARAAGERFQARAVVVKPGRKQIFTRADLVAIANGEEQLVATGEAILIPT